MATHTLSFICEWIKSPRKVGSVVPSGPFLARKMAQEVQPQIPGVIIELGGGTGSLTQALLKRVSAERLIVIESNKGLARLLQLKFPNVCVLHNDAKNLSLILAKEKINEINCIISGLPLLSIKATTRHKILYASFSLLAPGRKFIQFTYGPQSPIPKNIIAKHNLSASVKTKAWLNIPPAKIWTYTKRD